MLVLDTADLAVSDRGDAYQQAVSANCTTSAATFEDGPLWARIYSYDLGVAKVLNIDASGTTLRRTPRMARGMNDCPITLALPVRTVNHLSWDREARAFAQRDLMLVDLSAPYVYHWSGDGASYAFHVDLDDLDVPMDTLRAAIPNLRRSPIYALVRDHLSSVMFGAEAIVESGSAVDVGAASAELMRALIVSAAEDSRRLRDAMHTSLAGRVQAYVRHHLSDPDLGPAKIAAANAISVRELYRLYERIGVSLEASIITQRLARVHDELVAPEKRHIPIATIASTWGFGSASFFAARFKNEYGMTPRQWRDAGLTSSAEDSQAG